MRDGKQNTVSGVFSHCVDFVISGLLFPPRAHVFALMLSFSRGFFHNKLTQCAEECKEIEEAFNRKI